MTVPVDSGSALSLTLAVIVGVSAGCANAVPVAQHHAVADKAHAVNARTRRGNPIKLTVFRIYGLGSITRAFRTLARDFMLWGSAGVSVAFTFAKP